MPMVETGRRRAIPQRSYAAATRRGRGMGALGAALDYGTLVQLAQNAGFSGSDAQVAAAIALAESSGNSGAYNPETQAKGGTPQGQGSYGLWQIYLKAHPQFNGQNLYDPQTNANAAYQVFLQQGFSAWTTFTDAAYMAYLYSPPAPGQAAPASAPLTIDASTGQPIEDVTPTPDAASVFSPGGASKGEILFLTAAAYGLYLLADHLSD